MKVQKSLVKNTFIGIIGLVLVVGLINFYSASNSNNSNNDLNLEKTSDTVSSENVDKQVSGELVNGVREVSIEAYQFGWDPEEIVVNQGEKVKLTVTSRDVAHGIMISGLETTGVGPNEQIRPGEPGTLEFTASETGEWTILCSIYCGSGHSRMRGKLIVK